MDTPVNPTPSPSRSYLIENNTRTVVIKPGDDYQHDLAGEQVPEGKYHLVETKRLIPLT